MRKSAKDGGSRASLPANMIANATRSTAKLDITNASTVPILFNLAKFVPAPLPFSAIPKSLARLGVAETIARITPASDFPSPAITDILSGTIKYMPDAPATPWANVKVKAARIATLPEWHSFALANTVARIAPKLDPSSVGPAGLMSGVAKYALSAPVAPWTIPHIKISESVLNPPWLEKFAFARSPVLHSDIIGELASRYVLTGDLTISTVAAGFPGGLRGLNDLAERLSGSVGLVKFVHESGRSTPANNDGLQLSRQFERPNQIGATVDVKQLVKIAIIVLLMEVYLAAKISAPDLSEWLSNYIEFPVIVCGLAKLLFPGGRKH